MSTENNTSPEPTTTQEDGVQMSEPTPNVADKVSEPTVPNTADQKNNGNQPPALDLNIEDEDEKEIPNPNIVLLRSAYEKLMDVVSDREYTPENILVLITKAVQIVQKMKRGKEFLTGPEKKAIVMSLIKKWVKYTPYLSDSQRQYIQEVFIPTMLSGIVDSLCEINIHKMVEKCGVFKCLCS